MFIKTFVSGPFETNGYLVGDEVTKDAIIIDAPPDFSSPVLKEIKKQDYKVKYIINTHGHIDHIADNHILKEELNSKLLIHKNDLFWLNSTDFIKSLIPFEIIPSEPDDFIDDGDIIKVGSLSFIIIFTPGHTSGGICLYEKESKVLFTGDTLFKENIGRTDLPGGSTDILIDSIKNKILNLPGDVIIYPGHGETSTINDEKNFNPFL
jgi:glyoxylase-like metal-dependent hydrolase (beta-lactamase superfamily II)